MFDMNDLPKWKLGYIAGIIDGEGCITLSKYDVGIKPRVIVGMTDPVCVNTLENVTTVGTVYSVGHGRGKRKCVYTWTVSKALDIYLLLKAVFPYLIIKRKQAEVMINFVERRIQGMAQNSYDEELVCKLHELNE